MSWEAGWWLFGSLVLKALLPLAIVDCGIWFRRRGHLWDDRLLIGGLLLSFLGMTGNLSVKAANGGPMPVLLEGIDWRAAPRVLGADSSLCSWFHDYEAERKATSDPDRHMNFVEPGSSRTVHAAWLADSIPMAVCDMGLVMSIGDVVVVLGVIIALIGCLCLAWRYHRPIMADS